MLIDRIQDLKDYSNNCKNFDNEYLEDDSEWYQDIARIYLDEYLSNEPEVETDNFFYERFMRRK